MTAKRFLMGWARELRQLGQTLVLPMLARECSSCSRCTKKVSIGTLKDIGLTTLRACVPNGLVTNRTLEKLEQ